MDLAYGPAYTAFREEVRSFLKKNWASSEQFKGDPAKLTPEQRELSGLPRVERDRAFRQKAIAAGYLYRSVPRRWGAHVFSDTVVTKLLPNRHGDSGGVRGAAWLWPLARD